MLLMIDNYDSFTYNLVQYFGELGQEVVVYRNDEISINEIELLKLGFSLSSEPANNDSWHILGVMIRQLFYYQNNLYLSFIIYLEDCLLNLGYYDQYDLVQTLQQIHFQYHFYSRLQIHPRTCYQKLNQSALLAHH